MTAVEDYFEKYEDIPLYFSHYYNFLFIYKSQEMGRNNKGGFVGSEGLTFLLRYFIILTSFFVYYKCTSTI